MTGDFEIIEEPLPGTPGAAVGPAPTPEPPPISVPRKQGGPKFPELMK